MPDTRVLVVDDERSMREVLAIMLKQAGHDVTVADGGEAAIRALQSNTFDLVITDLRMRQVDGLAVLRATKEHSPQTVVLVVTAFASTETAVEAMKLGAYDYLTKPFKLDEIKLTIANALERKRLQDENQALKRQLRRERGFESFIGKSRQMLDIFDTIRKAAESDSTVLVTGESGTGKELVARAFRRVADTRDVKVDVRLIAASNRDVAKAVADGALREDLFYRLNVIPVHLPPLRERREDIPPLVAHFVPRLSAELGRPVRSVTPEALAILEHYHWPGNVRELENVIERALVLGSGDTLEASALPPDLRRPRNVQEIPVEVPEEGLDLEATLSQIEQRYIQMALARTGGVQTRAADLLRVSFRQFRYKLQKYARLASRS